MKTLPHVDQNYSELFKILMAPVRSKLMMTAIELDVFSNLTEFTCANAVARAIKTHPENTRRFLDGLALIDLLEKKDGLYRNAGYTGISSFWKAHLFGPFIPLEPENECG